MKVLVTGASGQLGRELNETVPNGYEVVALSRAELDLVEPEAVERALRTHAPEVVINAAAYTSVDAAESESEQAFAVNAGAAGRLAAAATQAGARMIHVSTDFVFGEGHGRPWAPGDSPAPLGVYGSSKLEGEQLVAAATNGRALVLRTAWLYSRHGRNFVTTVLGKMRLGEPLEVVEDQIGTPTWARRLARALWRTAADPGVTGTHHWTDAGVASWYDFAVAIQEEALELGTLDRPVDIRPVRTEAFPTPARRPSFSVLDKTATWKALGIEPVHWRQALRDMLVDERGGSGANG